MKEERQIVVYWDTSALLSVLFEDSHSQEAHKWFQQQGLHLISTLAYSEVYAVITRLHKERIIARAIAQAAFEALEQGPWRRLNAVPSWKIIRNLSTMGSLRGADLWHLATVQTLQEDLPELTLLTFDKRLRSAAKHI
jgi:predicted nucleic acid-binding protein